MKLKDPIDVREALMKKHGWMTVEEIAKQLSIAANTASRALRGEPVRITTIRTIADALGVSSSDIAEFVN
jgi:transcriptional regulator with XRE-family HTH domain